MDKGEASRLATSKLGLEAKCEAAVDSARVYLCQLLPHLGMVNSDEERHHLSQAFDQSKREIIGMSL